MSWNDKKEKKIDEEADHGDSSRDPGSAHLRAGLVDLQIDDVSLELSVN